MDGAIKNKQVCRICQGTEFFKDSGHYYCMICQTQSDDIREEILDVRVDTSIRLRKIKIRKLRSDGGETIGWTSWELYNFVLVGLVNELIELGASFDIKLTVLQLWATYLGKIEVAFTSTKIRQVPKLARRYNKRDAEIIYGLKNIKKLRKRKSKSSKGSGSASISAISDFHTEGSSIKELNKHKRNMVNAEYDKYLQSEASSDRCSSFSHSSYSSYSDETKSVQSEKRIRFNSCAYKEARKVKEASKNLPLHKRRKYKERYIRSQYKASPQLITGTRLWAIIYLALRIHNQPIQLGDMIRYAREGHLSYYRLDYLLPPEVVVSKNEANFLCQNTDLTHKGMRRMIAGMAKFIGVHKIPKPDFLSLVNRYCQELELPRGISLYAERLIALSPPTMAFDPKKPCVPNYEARAMAFIIVVLKLLLGLDGTTEQTISNIAEQINRVNNEQQNYHTKLFSFCEWQRYIECRKSVLTDTHFPSQLKYNPDIIGKSEMYIRFLDYIRSKRNREEPEISNYKHYIPRDLADALKKCIENLNQNCLPQEDVQIFAPSQTPFHSYLQQLLYNSTYELPQILRTNFYETKVGYMTKPTLFQKLAAQCNIELEIIDSSLASIEKLVPVFEQTKIPELSELQLDVEIQEGKNTSKIEDFVTYVDRRIPFNVKIDHKKLSYLENNQDLSKEVKEKLTLNDHDEFIFNAVSSNGKLLIPKDMSYVMEDNETSNNVYKKFNIQLSYIENESMRKPQIIKRNKCKIPQRDSKGKFVKSNQKKLSKVNSEEEQSYSDFIEVNESHSKSDISKEQLNLSTTTKLKQTQNMKDKEYNENTTDLKNALSLSDISILEESNEELDTTKTDIQYLKFFRPFKEYWMYHCVFSRMKSKNFELFEKLLPDNFRWLLIECANLLEMTTEDLYKEVCEVESFHVHVLKPDKKSTNPRVHHILTKW